MKRFTSTFTIRKGDLELQSINPGSANYREGGHLLAEICQWEGSSKAVIAFIENRSNGEREGDVRTIGGRPFEIDVDQTAFAQLCVLGIELTRREGE